MRFIVYTQYQTYKLYFVCYLWGEANDKLRAAFPIHAGKGNYILSTWQDGFPDVYLPCAKARKECFYAHDRYAM